MGIGGFRVRPPFTMEDLTTEAPRPSLHAGDGSARHATQASDEIDDPSSSIHRDIDFYRDIPKNSGRAMRGLRGDVSRAAQDVEFPPRAIMPDGSGDGFPLSNSTAANHPLATALSDSSMPSTRTSPTEDPANSFLYTLMSFLILSPCLLAAVAQTVYCYRKRKHDRLERELEEVSTNPQSRMLVLNEIFKNDSRPVTENDASPQKKRVLVKKHRKKTRSESRGTKKQDATQDEAEAGDDKEMGGTGIGHLGTSSNDWSSEEENILSASDGKPMVVFVSSYDHLDSGGADVEMPLRGRDQDVDAPGDKRTPTMIYVSDDAERYEEMVNVEASLGRESEEENVQTTVYVPENIESHCGVKSGHELPPGQGQASNFVDRKEKETSQGKVDNIEWALKLNGTAPEVGMGEELADDGVGREEGGGVEVLGSTGVTYDSLIGSKDSDGVALDGAENLNVGNQDGRGVVSNCMPRSGVAPDHELQGKPEEGLETMKDLAAEDALQTVPLSPEVTTASPPDNANHGANQEILVGEGTLCDKSLTEAATLSSPKNPPPDIPPLSIVTASPEIGYLSPCASLDEMEATCRHLTPRAPTLPNMSDSGSEEEVDKDLVFRAISNFDQDDESIPQIHGCGSSVTEVTSNVDELLKEGTTGGASTSFEDLKLEPLRTSSHNEATVSSLFAPYQMDRTDSGDSSTLSSLGLGVPIPMNSRVESFQSAGSTTGTSVSNISYFSYEDISIASEESEMCAICLCPYEEGDIRIFSKRCPHAFHKECILEWLVKSHNECPCCRKNMVTKSEIKETSASLIGTERLARAMAVVEGSEMREAPPFRRGIRRPPRMVARQMLARAREQARAQRDRRGSPGVASSSGNAPPASPNAHWLWSARHGQQPSSPSSNVVNRLPPGLSSMPRLDEVGPHSSPRLLTPRPSNNGPDNAHNRDWLWATRHGSSTLQQTPPSINPSRSSDAIMNPHETNAVSRSSDAIMNPYGANAASAAPEAASPNAAPADHQTTPTHHTAAGSLFSSTLHNHWQQQQRQGPQTTVTRASLHHEHWQQLQQQQQRQCPPTTATRATLQHSHWQQPQPQTTTPRTTLHHSHWHQRQNTQTSARRIGNFPSSPPRVHAHWRQNTSSNANANNEEEPLPVTVLPAI